MYRGGKEVSKVNNFQIVYFHE